MNPTGRVRKRAFDVVFAAGLLLLISPLLVAVAGAIKLTSKGPVLYRARRAGRFGVPFAMLKFRTMRSRTDSSERKITAAGDDRITRLGALLRQTKIDELPQLWNVLRGDMSIVGPRPEDHDFVKQHWSPSQRRLLAVRPGLAGPAEVRWYPDLTWHDPPPAGVPIQQHYLQRHMPAQIREGLRYVDEQSLWRDLCILGGTAINVLVRSWWPPSPRPLDATDCALPSTGAQEGR